ncbi:MAG: DsbA family protein [Gammaproteobacteria bacterium]
MISENTPAGYDLHSELKVAVSEAEHVLGSSNAPVTLVEYGDFGCRFCEEASLVVKKLQVRFGQGLRFVFRHNPRGELHAHARLAAEASEAAALQGKFWGMHDLLFSSPKALEEADLVRYAMTLGLDAEKFSADLRSPAVAKHVRDDEVGGVHSVIITTPTFFINGGRFEGDARLRDARRSDQRGELRSVSAMPNRSAYAARSLL